MRKFTAGAVALAFAFMATSGVANADQRFSLPRIPLSTNSAGRFSLTDGSLTETGGFSSIGRLRGSSDIPMAIHITPARTTTRHTTTSLTPRRLRRFLRKSGTPVACRGATTPTFNRAAGPGS